MSVVKALRLFHFILRHFESGGIGCRRLRYDDGQSLQLRIQFILAGNVRYQTHELLPLRAFGQCLGKCRALMGCAMAADGNPVCTISGRDMDFDPRAKLGV